MEKLKTHMEETEEFRQMQISPESLKRLRQFVKEERMDFSECLAVLLVEQDFVLDGSVELDRETLQRKIALFQRKKPKPFGQLVLACEKIFWIWCIFHCRKQRENQNFSLKTDTEWLAVMAETVPMRELIFLAAAKSAATIRW